jgi:hypothetical protein
MKFIETPTKRVVASCVMAIFFSVVASLIFKEKFSNADYLILMFAIYAGLTADRIEEKIDEQANNRKEQ